MKNDFIILVTEYALIGSGYTSIAKMLIKSLNKLYPDTDIIVLGLSYKREEHDEDARIIAVQGFSAIPTMLHNIFLSGAGVRAIITALDIPLQAKLISWVRGNQKVPINDVPYIGVFPLESPPLSLSFADTLREMDSIFAMTEFAVQEIKRHGIEAELLPQSIDFNFWRNPTQKERAIARQKLFLDDDTYMVLVVGDNQERKNLSAAIEGFARFELDWGNVKWDERGYVSDSSYNVDARMHLVTRVNSPYGWDLTDLLFRNGVIGEVELHERGLDAEELRDLYWAADVLLSTSKAEGLGLPILEALSCRLTVIGVDGAATKEHLTAAGGLLMEPDYVIIDPFGNEERYLVSPQTVADALIDAYNSDGEYNGDRNYIIGRTHTEEFEESLKGAIDGKA